MTASGWVELEGFVMIGATHGDAVAGAEALAHRGARVDERDELEALAEPSEVRKMHGLADQPGADHGHAHALGAGHGHLPFGRGGAEVSSCPLAFGVCGGMMGVDMRVPGTLQVT